MAKSGGCDNHCLKISASQGIFQAGETVRKAKFIRSAIQGFEAGVYDGDELSSGDMAYKGICMDLSDPPCPNKTNTNVIRHRSSILGNNNICRTYTVGLRTGKNPPQLRSINMGAFCRQLFITRSFESTYFFVILSLQDYIQSSVCRQAFWTLWRKSSKTVDG
jgi:hypothetical protein